MPDSAGRTAFADNARVVVGRPRGVGRARVTWAGKQREIVSGICIGTRLSKLKCQFNWNAHTRIFYRNEMCILTKPVWNVGQWDSGTVGLWGRAMGQRIRKGLTNDMPSQRLLVFNMVNAIVFASSRLNRISVKRACWLYARIVVTPWIVSARCEMTGELLEFSMRCSSLEWTI